MLYLLLKYLVGPIILLILRPHVYGKQHLRVKGKAIFVSNHLSMGDPMLIGLISPRIVHFMAKKEIFQTWTGNMFFRGLFAFPVDRKNVGISSLKNALAVLEKGKVFGIFPEGKRSISGRLDEFEKGAAFLAVRSGAPVIPIYIHPQSYSRVHPIVMVGPPIDISRIVAASNRSTLIDVVTDEIADSIDGLRVRVEEIYCK